MGLPYQIAAEQEAKDEDEDGGAEHHDVDVEGEVLKSYIRHSETVVMEIRGHGCPGGGDERTEELNFFLLNDLLQAPLVSLCSYIASC